nr:hypothetical protein [Tanacetum cinerariifolium]
MGTSASLVPLDLCYFEMEGLPVEAFESQDTVIQDTNPSAPNDLLVLSLVEQMTDHVAHLDKENQPNKMIQPTLYDGNVIAKEHVVISMIDDEETLILEEESRSKMLDKQYDPISIEKKIKISPIDYLKLNKIKENFEKHFVTQKKLSAEQAFWLKHSSHSETPVTSHTPVIIEVPRELPKSVENSYLNAQLQEKVFVITTLKNELRKLKGKNVVNTVVSKPNATITPGMFKLDIEPISPRLKNNRDAREVYIDKTINYVDTLRGFVERARTQYPSEPLLESACMFLKRVQELLVYASQTCPNSPKPSEKLVAVTPTNKDKRVRFAKPSHLRTMITPKKIVYLKETTPKSVETPKTEIKVYSRRPKQIKSIGSSKKAKIVESKIVNNSEPTHLWGSNTTAIPFSSSLVNDRLSRSSYVLVATTPRAVEIANSPVSTSIVQDAPSLSIPSTQDQEHSLIINQVVKESPKTPLFHDDLFYEFLHEDSNSQGSSLNVIPSHTPFKLIDRWTKDHPIANVIGYPSRSVSTRKQLKTDAMWCYFDSFITLVEPKNIKQAMIEPSWIDAIQEEIYEFERLQNKARLVAQGFRQEEETNFKESFALVARIEAILDPTLFTWKARNDLLLVQIYVDDIIFASTNTALCNEFANQMTTKFKMSMMDQMSFFLGLQISQSPRGIFLNQSNYASKIIKKSGLLSSDSVDTYMVEKNRLDKDLQATPVDATLYRGMIRSLMYLTSSRPDLIYADTDMYLTAYSDADHAGCLDTRRSTSGSAQFLGDKLVSWSSKKQKSTAISNYGFTLKKIPLYCDNKSAIALCYNNVQHSRAKHIDRKIQLLDRKAGYEKHVSRNAKTIMNPQETQQVVARDEKWVPSAERVKIISTNIILETKVPQKEETFQVIIDVIKNSTQQEVYCPRVKSKDFTDVPDDETALTFLIDLGYKGPLDRHTNMFIDHIYQSWRTLAAIISKCLSGKTASNDKLRKSRIDIFKSCKESPATHARIMTESVHEFAKKKSSGRSSKSVVMQDTPSTPKSKPATSKSKLKGAPSLTPAKQKATNIMQALKERDEQDTEFSNDDDEKDDKDGDDDNEGDDHISDTQDTNDEDDKHESDEDEIYKYKIRVHNEEDVKMKDAEVEEPDKGEEKITNAAKEEAKKSSEVKDDTKKSKLPPTSSSLSVSSGFGDQFLKLSSDSSLVSTVKDSTEADVSSLLDIPIQHETPQTQSPSAQKILVSVISETTNLPPIPEIVIETPVSTAVPSPQVTPIFSSIQQTPTPIPTQPITTNAPTITTTVLESNALSTIELRVEKDVSELKIIDQSFEALVHLPELTKKPTPTTEQESEKIPSEILKIKKEQAERQKNPQLIIKSTDKAALE